MYISIYIHTHICIYISSEIRDPPRAGGSRISSSTLSKGCVSPTLPLLTLNPITAKQKWNEGLCPRGSPTALVKAEGKVVKAEP